MGPLTYLKWMYLQDSLFFLICIYFQDNIYCQLNQMLCKVVTNWTGVLEQIWTPWSFLKHTLRLIRGLNSLFNFRIDFHILVFYLSFVDVLVYFLIIKMYAWRGIAYKQIASRIENYMEYRFKAEFNVYFRLAPRQKWSCLSYVYLHRGWIIMLIT